MANATAWEIGTASWLIKVGTDEDGEDVLKEVTFVTATNPEGTIYRHFVTFDAPEAAEALAARVTAAPSWVGPVSSPHWSFWRAMYGSVAYSRNWLYYEAETELSEREAELGPEAAFRSLPEAMQAALS